MTILLNCPLKHINGAVEFFLAHQSRMCEKPLENKNNNYTWYIYIYTTENQSSQNQWVASKTLISPFSLIKKKNLSNSSFCFAFDTCAQPHWKCAHVCVYMQVHMHTQTGTTHT